MSSGKSSVLTSLWKRYHSAFKPHAYNPHIGPMHRLVAHGQNPETLIIACMDSRTVPGVILKLHPGEAFSAANTSGRVLPYNEAWETGEVSVPDMAANITLAVSKHVSNILVINHTHCAGVDTYVNGTDNPLLKAWARQNAPHVLTTLDRTRPQEEMLRHAERLNAIANYWDLMTYPVVQDAVKRGDLHTEVWLNDIEGGHLFHFDPERNVLVEEQDAHKYPDVPLPPLLQFTPCC